MVLNNYVKMVIGAKPTDRVCTFFITALPNCGVPP
jgi:hypothetical protein